MLNVLILEVKVRDTSIYRKAAKAQVTGSLSAVHSRSSESCELKGFSIPTSLMRKVIPATWAAGGRGRD